MVAPPADDFASSMAWMERRFRGVSNWLTGKIWDWRIDLRAFLGFWDGAWAVMAAMLRRVRSRREVRRFRGGSVGAGGGDGRRGESCSGTGEMAFGNAEPAMDMRVRSMRDKRGCGFLTGEGVALLMEEIIWSAIASSGFSIGGSEGK